MSDAEDILADVGRTVSERHRAQEAGKRVFFSRNTTRRRWHYVMQDGVCHYCAAFTPYKSWTIDHMTPKSRGGSLHHSNVVGCCAGCNDRKGRMTEAEFERQKEIERHTAELDRERV